MDTIGVEQARALVLQRLSHDKTHDFVISKTNEYEFGWVFNYVPRKFSETGDNRYLVPGNNPLLEVLSDSITDPDDAIAQYLRYWRQSHQTR